jgi:GxxExxY protein
LAYELQKLNLHVERQKAVPLIYEAIKLECGFRADLVVENRLVVECKCKDALHPVDEAQLLSHLRLLDLRVGLLINFHVLRLKDGIRRLVNNYQEPAEIEFLEKTKQKRSLTAKIAKGDAKDAKKTFLGRRRITAQAKADFFVETRSLSYPRSRLSIRESLSGCSPEKILPEPGSSLCVSSSRSCPSRA